MMQSLPHPAARAQFAATEAPADPSEALARIASLPYEHQEALGRLVCSAREQVAQADFLRRLWHAGAAQHPQAPHLPFLWESASHHAAQATRDALREIQKVTARCEAELNSLFAQLLPPRGKFPTHHRLLTRLRQRLRETQWNASARVLALVSVSTGRGQSSPGPV